MSVSATFHGTIAQSTLGETVSLGGTQSSPRPVQSFNTEGVGQAAFSGWLFGCTTSAFNSIERGQVQKASWEKNGGVEQQAIYTSVDTSTSWIIPNDFQNGPYYIRAQLLSGTDQPDTGSGLPLETVGAADDTADWFALTNGGPNIFWIWKQETSAGLVSGTIKVEISTTNSEAGILTTGWYRGIAALDF